MLEQIVLNTIKQYQLIESGDRLVVGVSGGPDSMCLLNLLIEIQKQDNGLDFEICVAHVNHGIRKEAVEEATFVKAFCAKQNILYYEKTADVLQMAKEEKTGTEEAGRKLRYNFFEEIARKTNSNKIATAHQLNDQVETVLMNLLRGCGLSGLTGMEIIRENRYIRPLLEVKRQQIEQYCKENNLKPKQDSSNQEMIYTRNKIRNGLIPYLEENFNPNITKAIYQLSQITKEEQNYLEKMVHTIYKQLVKQETENQIILDLKQFNGCDKVIQKGLVRYTVGKLFGSVQNIEKIHMEDILKLAQRNIGNKYLMPNKNLKVYVKKNQIFFICLKIVVP